jgi:hypothetical protein
MPSSLYAYCLKWIFSLCFLVIELRSFTMFDVVQLTAFHTSCYLILVSESDMTTYLFCPCVFIKGLMMCSDYLIVHVVEGINRISCYINLSLQS